MRFWWYLATYLLFDMAYIIILVPYETLVPDMTDNFKQKTRFSGVRIALVQLLVILTDFLRWTKRTRSPSSTLVWCSR